MHPKLFTLFHLSVGQTISQTLNVALSVLKLGSRFSIYCNRQSVLHKMNTCSCAQVYIYISLLLANHIPVSTKPPVVSLAARPEGRFTCRTAFSSGKLTVNDILMSRTLQNLHSLQLLPPEPSRTFPNLEFRNLYFQNLLGTRLQSSLSILLLRKKIHCPKKFNTRFPFSLIARHLNISPAASNFSKTTSWGLPSPSSRRNTSGAHQVESTHWKEDKIALSTPHASLVCVSSVSFVLGDLCDQVI